MGIIRLSDIKEREVKWLWHPYIPKGRITIIEGNPGLGKTWISLKFSAAVSSGGLIYNGTRAEKGNVIYVSAEDSVADTLKPRMEELGANFNNIYTIEDDGEWELSNKNIESLFSEIKPSLFVLDPIQAFFRNTTSASKTRPILAKLSDMAEEYDCAIILIRHLVKNTGMNSLYRGMGSIDFTGAARSVLLVGRNPISPKQTLVSHIKSSLAEVGKSISYTVDDGVFKWGNYVDVNLGFNDEEESKLEEAKQFLAWALEEGERPAAEVLQEARKIGISVRTFYRARRILGVKSRREGKMGSRGGGQWILYLKPRITAVSSIKAAKTAKTAKGSLAELKGE